MKIFFIATAIVLFSDYHAFCQKGFNKDYYKNLKSELLKDSTITDVKLYDKKYRSGNQKVIFASAKFKNDSINRWWITGKWESYHKNGQLATSTMYDSKGKLGGENNIIFRKNGKVWFEINFYDTSGYYISKYNKNYCKIPDNGLAKYYRKDGRLRFEGELKYNYKSKRIVKNGFLKKYSYSRGSTKIVEQQYDMNKRISKRKYIQ